MMQDSPTNHVFNREFIQRESMKVILGGLTTGIGGITIGSLLAVQKNIPASLPAISMCIKTSTFGTAFFGLRQFVINPICQLRTSSPTRSKHLDGILPTSLSAAIIGGSVNSYLRGRKVAARSAFTTALVCCGLHLMYNELGLLKDYFVNVSSRKEESTNDSLPAPPWWEPWIPLSKISDRDWKDRLNSELSLIDRKLTFIDRQLSSVQRAILRHPESNPPLKN